jgi:hypothetical protein
MTRISFGVIAFVLLSACAQTQTVAPVSDLASHPALPPPSEAALAAAPELAVTRSPWVQRPNVADFMEAYPRSALASDIGGVVELDCLAQADYRMACLVRSETPRGYDFAAAAMALSGKLRITPVLENGQATPGGKMHWTVNFAANTRDVTTPLNGPHAGP